MIRGTCDFCRTLARVERRFTGRADRDGFLWLCADCGAALPAVPSGSNAHDRWTALSRREIAAPLRSADLAYISAALGTQLTNEDAKSAASAPRQAPRRDLEALRRLSVGLWSDNVRSGETPTLRIADLFLIQSALRNSYGTNGSGPGSDTERLISGLLRDNG